MRSIIRYALTLFLLLICSILVADIENIQYEGTWARSHNYDWGFAKHENDLYVGDNTRVEKYHILENGDLEYVSNYEGCNGLISDIHVAGDSLYIVNDIGDSEILSIIDITDGEFERTAVYENLSDSKMDCTFFSNERYVYYLGFSPLYSYYYDRCNHTLNEWSVNCGFIQDIANDFIISSEWNNNAGKCEIKIQDISNIDTPQVIYVSEPDYGNDVNVKSINDSILVILDMLESENTTNLEFWNISNPEEPISLSRLSMGYYDWFANPVRPIVIEDYLYITTHSNSGNRYIYIMSVIGQIPFCVVVGRQMIHIIITRLLNHYALEINSTPNGVKPVS